MAPPTAETNDPSQSRSAVHGAPIDPHGERSGPAPGPPSGGLFYDDDGVVHELPQSTLPPSSASLR